MSSTPEPAPGGNAVVLAGKVSKAAKLAYTPAGIAVLEFTLAAPQRYFGKDSMGNFEILLVGDFAEELASQVRIGKKLSLKGKLWTRTFRNRQGMRLTETKVLAESIGGNDVQEK